jgi:hypothetical protein
MIKILKHLILLIKVCRISHQKLDNKNKKEIENE